jgi:DNA modification methylase
LSPSTRERLQSWQPIFLYRRAGCRREVLPEGRPWGRGLHNLDCCVAAAPEGDYPGEGLRQHPCQKPVAVTRWLIHALSEPGDQVASAFCGVAPCGVAAVRPGRRYHGAEADAGYRRAAEGRIAAYGGGSPVP